MHYFLSAGEPSGDLHASHLMGALRDLDPDARFTYLGGDLMRRQAGTEPVIHYSRMAFMGFSEVLRNLGTIRRNFAEARRAIEESRPDALILVDYPSFNLKLAAHARALGIPVIYFIAPKVWAWKAWRVREIRRNVDLLLSILPFEPEWFGKRGVKALYVGNPSQEEVDEKLASTGTLQDFATHHRLDPGRPILALVPGSRRGEVRNNLPLMAEVAARHPGYQAVIAKAPGLTEDFYRTYSTLPLVEADTFRLMRFATAALVTSGTATLECALAGTPQVACYRANASRLSYNIMKRLIKVPYVTLPNLISSRPVIPEMLVHLCTPDGVDRELTAILPGAPGRDAQLRGYALMRSRLGTDPAAATAARQIISYLKGAVS